jgi:hypothetical protein
LRVLSGPAPQGRSRRIVITNSDWSILGAVARCLDQLEIEWCARERRDKSNGHRRGVEIVIGKRAAIEHRMPSSVEEQDEMSNAELERLVAQGWAQRFALRAVPEPADCGLRRDPPVGVVDGDVVADA